MDKTSQYSGAAKEKTQGDDDVGEESKNEDDDVGLTPIAGLDHLSRLLKTSLFCGMQIFGLLWWGNQSMGMNYNDWIVTIFLTWKKVFAPGACSFK